MDASPDILVLGGGPAGLVSAVSLARKGWRVALVAHPRRSAVEGFSAQAVSTLRIAGCDHALAALGPEAPRTVYWNGETRAIHAEILVERGRLDAALARDAREARIAVHTARLISFRRIPGGWSATLAGRDGRTQALSARFLIEARGLAAPSGGAGESAPDTLALIGRWRLARADPFTAVAGFRSGWAWCAHIGDGTCSLSLFVSAKRPDLPRRSRLPEFYRGLLRDIPEAASWLGGAADLVSVTARKATARLISPAAGPDFLRLGDAAFTIDPLSGHGTFEAIRAALTTPALVNTLLERPDASALAQDFHRNRVEESFVRHARVGRDFYRMEQRWSAESFWAERQAWPDDELAHPSPFSAPSSIAVRPVIEEDWIVPRDVVVTPDHPMGVWRIGDIPVVPLLRGALPPSSPGAEAALAWLRWRGLLG